jgi:hypothetical protein
MICYTEQELMRQFDEFVDGCKSEINIGMCTYAYSEILKKMNHNDYMHMFNDWLDSAVDSGYVYEYDNEYYDQDPMVLITDTLKALKVAS